jgi:hypothetical protein
MHRRTVITAVTTVAIVLGSLVPAAGAEARPPVPSAMDDCPVLGEAPTPYGPSGTVLGGRPLFSWSAVSGVDEYVVEILYASNDGDYVIPAQTVAGTTFRPSQPLPFWTGMRWQVKAECDERYGPLSETTYFDLEPRCRLDNC